MRYISVISMFLYNFYTFTTNERLIILNDSFLYWKKLFGDTVSPNNSLFGDTLRNLFKFKSIGLIKVFNM